MPRVTIALLLLCAPSWAAPTSVRRQPTPESVHSGAEGTPAGRADAARDPGKPNRALSDDDARNRDWDRKVKKSLGGVCRGC